MPIRGGKAVFVELASTLGNSAVFKEFSLCRIYSHYRILYLFFSFSLLISLLSLIFLLYLQSTSDIIFSQLHRRNFSFPRLKKDQLNKTTTSTVTHLHTKILNPPKRNSLCSRCSKRQHNNVYSYIRYYTSVRRNIRSLRLNRIQF